MDEDEPALGRVPIPSRNLVSGADLRTLTLLRGLLGTSFARQGKPLHATLIRESTTLEGVGRVPPDLQRECGMRGVVICGDHTAQAQVQPLFADCHGVTRSLPFAAPACELRPDSARLFPYRQLAASEGGKVAATQWKGGRICPTRSESTL